MNTYAWLHKSGLWLRVSLSTPFGLSRVESGQTQDLHEAYIGVELPCFADDTQVSEYTAVPAWIERRVFIGKKTEEVPKPTSEQMMNAYLASATDAPEKITGVTELQVLGLSKTLHNRLVKAGYMTVESVLNTGSSKLLHGTPLTKPQYRELYTALGNHDYDVQFFVWGPK